MTIPVIDEKVLSTSTGDFPLNEYCLNEGGREWRVLHVNALVSRSDEDEYLLSAEERLPYGATLWAAAIALAHDIAPRSEFRSTKVLELGAGTGLPGIVADSNGARVVQTDGNDIALSLAARNHRRNAARAIIQRKVDWSNWDDRDTYEWIIGSDILYAGEMHQHLKRIFHSNLAAGGRVLLSDPFRQTSLKLLTELEDEGWSIKISKWRVGAESASRPVGVFELVPPPRSGHE